MILDLWFFEAKCFLTFNPQGATGYRERQICSLFDAV